MSEMSIGERYSRQVAFRPVGPEGQRKLAEASVVIVGCGALGSSVAELLARAGVGNLKIIDRDFVELSNLSRQALFDTQDAEQVLPKAEAARRKLARINPEIAVQSVVADLTPKNVLPLLRDADVIVDGTDNVETRYLLNDAAIELELPWIYGGAVGSRGMVMAMLPRITACLRCLFLEPAPPGTLATCETEGIIGPAAHVVASLESVEALKILVIGPPPCARLTFLDVWARTFRPLHFETSDDCPACVKGDLIFLRAKAYSNAVVLCGRNAVQVCPPQTAAIDLADLAKKLAPLGNVVQNDFLLCFQLPEHRISVFSDGRAIIKGTTDSAKARSLYARYIGS